jgi:hypothetical protein
VGGEGTRLNGTFINTVNPRQAKLLQPGDRVVAINGINLLHAAERGVEQAIASCGDRMEMVVARSRYIGSTTAGLANLRFDRTELGEVETFTITDALLEQLRMVYIPHGSDAEHFVELESQGLLPGSRLLAVNGTLVCKQKMMAIAQLLEDAASQGDVVLDVWALPAETLRDALHFPADGVSD